MPRLPSAVVLDTLSRRNNPQTATNTTSQVLHVICEFPLSGQYGVGCRVLYYILIAVCLVKNKSELLKQVCLATALIFPAVAAIHAVVLAALHNNGFVDMDIFGTFQLCSIGILVGPVTVKRSGTYWKASGRKLLLPWTILILTGLLSLTVEFCRTKTHACLYSDSGLPTSTDARVFNYTYPPTCNLTCSAVTGPFSRIRQGSANNVFVVPAPERITFGMGTLFSAGCCIPPVLYLMSIWIKILKHNWTEDWAIREDDEQGAGGSTKATPGNIKELARKILDYESLVIGALVVCILVLGELNFSSAQVNWQSEPMSAIGQWATIVGAAFAVSGAWYVKKQGGYMPSVIRAMLDRCQLAVSSRGVAARNTNDEAQGLPRRRTSKEAIVRPPPQAVPTPGERVSGESLHLVRTPNRTATRRDLFVHEVEWRDDHGNRFIKIPYEEYFHRNYDKTKARYERSRGADRSVTPVRGQHSRSGSSNSVNVGEGIAPGEPSTASAEQSPRWPTLPNESTSSEQLQAGQQGSLRLEVPSVPRAQRASASGWVFE